MDGFTTVRIAIGHSKTAAKAEWMCAVLTII